MAVVTLPEADRMVGFQVFLEVVANLVAKVVRAFVGEFQAADLFAELHNPGGLLRLRHILGAVGGVVETDHDFRFARFTPCRRWRHGSRVPCQSRHPFPGWVSPKRFQRMPTTMSHCLDRQIFVNRSLRALLVDTRTDIGFPTEHSELHVAFAGRVAVEGCGNVGDVLPLDGNVLRESDE